MLDVPKPGDTDEIAVSVRMTSEKMRTVNIAICTSNA